MILYTSDIKKSNLTKTIITYILITTIVYSISKIYSVFSHNVNSAFMSLMFLYPLIGGVLIFSVIKLFFKNIYHYKYYRLSYNIYNSGVGTLVVGSLLIGIFEIAGTSSNFTKFYYIFGLIQIIFAILLLLIPNLRRPANLNS